MQFVHVTLPTIYGPYLVNNDPSGLTDDELQTIDEFIDLRGCEYDLFFCTGVNEETNHTDQHALYSSMIRHCECSDYCFQIEG